MWTDESKEAYLIAEVVDNQFARSLLFQARVNIELFKHSTSLLHESLEQLNHHNFAGAFGTCHINSGVFGSEIHASNKVTYTQRVLGFLLSSITSGHRLVKCLRAARKLDRGQDWVNVRKEISLLEGDYRRVRNVLEHLPDAIMNQDFKENSEIGFTPEAIFNASDKNGEFTFNFSKTELGRPVALYEQVLENLSSRKNNDS
jgi:hypothetical protein